MERAPRGTGEGAWARAGPWGPRTESDRTDRRTGARPSRLGRAEAAAVFGRVRGIVHAGAMGDRTAIICAIELAATQIRIADVRARAPEDDTHRTPEIACIEDGQIIVQTWEEYRR